MAQNRTSENNSDRLIVENKPYKYEYVIIRGIINSEVTKSLEPVSPKKRGKKRRNNFYSNE